MRRRRHAVPAHELAAELGVSVRTLYRDIATLVGQGAPIVDSPQASAAFYAALLGSEPAESSGPGIGLWSRHTVEPAATPAGGG